MENEKIRVVMLCGHGQSSNIMYHSLFELVNIERVILEDSPSKLNLLQRRAKKIGILKTSGQICFIMINKIISKMVQKEISRLIRDYGLNDAPIPENTISKVTSINSEEAISILKRIDPDAVVVNGTRIISKKVLASIKSPFINTHMGITPKYRGVHGGYWALAQGDRENCGVTVHLVDQGIDTGGVLYQNTIQPTQSDSFNTYPIHQIAKAIPLMIAALKDVSEDKISIIKGVPPSNLWYHPTILEYVKTWILKGVK